MANLQSFVQFGPQFVDVNIREIDHNEVGHKGWGLLQLPELWTPPFFVLKASAGVEVSRLGSDGPGWLLDTISNISEVEQLLSTYSHLLVRSSADDESIDKRGELTTLLCPATLDDLVTTICDSWVKNRFDGQNSAPPIVVQGYVRAAVIGHLSNERRVSKRHDSWLLELMNPDGALLEQLRIHPMPPMDSDDSELVAQSFSDLRRQLRRVPAKHVISVGDRPSRRHYEWIWDSRRIWIVQCDFDITSIGDPPGKHWPNTPSIPIPELGVLVTGESVSGDWNKHNCTISFGACGFQTAPLYVLEEERVLEQLARGEVAPEILSDVEAFVTAPTVVRSDVKVGVDYPKILLPRTETCTSADSVLTFLTKTSEAFVASGLAPGQFCFLLHRFIPARSGSYSMAAPRNQLVRIDGIWGFPDGLLFSPCDSFEVDVKNGEITWRQLRCKTSFLDSDQAGKWVVTRGGAPFDWEPSLSDEEIITIATQTHAIAQKENCRVEVMHFVGTGDETGLPKVLPWYSRLVNDNEQVSSISSAARLVRPSIIVRSFEDLESLVRSQKVTKPGTNIRLNPTPDLIRDREFLNGVIEFARQRNFGVELEGSALAHSFYLLSKSGIPVFSVGSEDPPIGHGLQLFGKLVRDAIPGSIESGGELAFVSRLTPSERLSALKHKLLEESFELREAGSETETLEEAADVYEVLLAIMDASSFSAEDLVNRANEKRELRGGFNSGLFLRATYLQQLIESSESTGRLFPFEARPEIDESLINPSIDKIDLRQDKDGDRLRIEISAIPPYGDRPEHGRSTQLNRFGVSSEIQVFRVGDRIFVDFLRKEPMRSDNAQLKLFDLYLVD